MDKVSSRHVTWQDIENPTRAMIEQLREKYSIHPLAVNELLVPTYRPKVEEYDEHLLLVLHFPVFDSRAGSIMSREIDFIIFPYTLITVHYDEVRQLDEYQELLANHEALRERTFGFSSGHLLYNIINQLFSISNKELDTMEERIQSIEEKIFSGREQEVLKEIGSVKRDILNFQKALKPQQPVLDSLQEHGKQFFGSPLKPYLSDIKAAYVQMWNSVENLRDIVDSLYETNISLLSANTNEIIKTLTIFTVVLAPISLITFIYSMDLPWIPLRDNHNAFWILIVVVLLMAAGIYAFFKEKKWL